MLRDGTADRLTNPPGRIGTETKATLVVELLGGTHQADIPLLNQVQQRQALVGVALSDAYNQAQIGLNELLAGALVAARHTFSQRQFLFSGQERIHTNLLQVLLHRIVYSATLILLLFAKLIISFIAKSSLIPAIISIIDIILLMKFLSNLSA